MHRLPEMVDGGDKLRRALAAFDFERYIVSKGARKESPHSLSREFLMRCADPRCRSSRLRVNATKRTWICWGCEASGDVLALIEHTERCDLGGAIDLVMRGYVGGDAKIETLESKLVVESPRPELRVLPPIAWPAGVDRLTDPRIPQHARAWGYLTSRGINVEMARAWGLGYGRHGRCKDRIVFPVYMDHALVYWQARATWNPPPGTSEEQRAWIERTGYIKTLNPLIEAGTRSAVAGEVVFNYDRVTVEPHVVITEGPFDAIKVGPHAVALLGKAGTPIKLERLRRLRASRFTIYLDRDPDPKKRAQEEKATEHIASELSACAPVWIAEPPHGRDAGDLSPEENAIVLAGARPWGGRTLKGIEKI